MLRFQPANVLVFAGLMAVTLFGGVARADAANTKIAVANTSRIFNDMAETKDLKLKLEERRKDVANEDQMRRTEINKMQQELSGGVNPNHPQYTKQLEELDKKMAEAESWQKVVRVQAEREQKSTMKNLFDKIAAAVADVAKDQQIDLVIADQGSELPNLEAVNFDQLRGIINQRAVLYSSSKIDISDAVLTLLDANYQKSKAGAVAPPARPSTPTPPAK